MKKIKHFMAMLLILVMVASMLAGCNNDQKNEVTSLKNGDVQKKTNKQDSKEMKKVDITVAIWDVEDALSGGANDKILSTVEEKIGVHFIPKNITWDDGDQKIKLWASSNSLPDIFVGDYVGKSFFYDWVEQGIIRALPEDLSAYPNLEKYLEIERAQAAKQDGKFYMIPRQTYGNITYSVLDRSVAYRWDLAQKAGVTKEPETYDEFRDMIKKIIEKDPENKNITGLTATLPSILCGFIIPYGVPLEKKWVKKDGQWMPGYFAGDIKAAFQLARDMYEEGTIEKDISLAKINISTEKFLQGQSAGIVLANSGPSSLYKSFAVDYKKIYPGRKFLDDVKVCKLLPCKDGKKHYFIDTEAWSESYFSSKVDDKKMETILKLYDFLYSEEGQRLVFCGIEGEDYNLKDGRIIMKENVNLTEKYPYTRGMSSLAMWNPSSWNISFPSDIPEEYKQLNVVHHEDAVKNGTLDDYSDAVLFLSTPLKDNFIFNPYDDFMKVMMGTEPVDKMVDDLMEEYEAKDYSAMIKEVNEKAKELGID